MRPEARRVQGCHASHVVHGGMVISEWGIVTRPEIKITLERLLTNCIALFYFVIDCNASEVNSDEIPTYY